MTKTLNDETCPCGSNLKYKDCCGRFLGSKDLPSDDPEELLRSRYLAYKIGDGDYLLKSWHKDFRPKITPKKLIADSKNIVFTGLKVIEKDCKGNDALIIYELRWRIGTIKQMEICKSCFKKVDNNWFYTKELS
ncbi:MAG: YchJ family protein [Succinivibrionaceae bacterium]